MIKHEWKKEEKNYYNPPGFPQLIEIPKFNFFSISGKGNPNDALFAEYVSALYSLSYAVKMDLKKRNFPGHTDYTVYPLEGIWQLENNVPPASNSTFNKDAFVFNLMIRQPDLISQAYAQEILKLIQKKKPNPLWDNITFKSITDGTCIQMLHTGSYDSENESFKQMETFMTQYRLNRKQQAHREIYLSDPRKTAPAKLRTILRFQIQ